MLNLDHAELADLPTAYQLLEEQFLADVDLALQNSTRLLARCRQLKAPSLAKPCLLQAKMLWGTGQYAQALRLSNQAARHLRSDNMPLLLAEHHLLRGLILMSLKRHSLALNELASAIDMALTHGQISIAIEAFSSVAQTYSLAGMLNESAKVLQLSYRLALSINDHKQIGKSAIFLAAQLLRQQQQAEALRILQHAEPSLLRHGDITWIVECGSLMAECHVLQGATEEAQLYFDSMLAIARQANARWSQAIISISYARFLLHLQQFAAASEILAQALRFSEQFDIGVLQQDIYSLQYQAFKASGLIGEALHALRNYHQLSLGMQQQTSGQTEVNSLRHWPRSTRVRARIDQSMHEFEYMLNLFSPGEASIRGRQLRLRCQRAAAHCRLICLHVQLAAQHAGLAEQKINGILRLLLNMEDIWVRLHSGTYLLFPKEQRHDARNQLANELQAAIARFPWFWHGLTPPQTHCEQIDPATALHQLLEVAHVPT